jgi:hypothetical protein
VNGAPRPEYHIEWSNQAVELKYPEGSPFGPIPFHVEIVLGGIEGLTPEIARRIASIPAEASLPEPIIERRA